MSSTDTYCPKCGVHTGNNVDGLCPTCRKQQQQEMELARLKINELKGRKSKSSVKMHWKYFMFGGFIIGLFLICCIFPLLFPGGRSLIKKAFGYW